MSQYTMQELADFVRTGFANEGVKAWHMANIPVDELIRTGRAFPGPIPVDVAAQIVLWEPVTFTQTVLIAPDGQGFNVPDRLSQVVGNPLSGNVVHIAGSGYNGSLHLEFDAALNAATDAGLDIAAVVCLGDGAHMGMTFRTRDGVTLGGNFGGAIPYVCFGSSLTGALASSVYTGTVMGVCDNTIKLGQMTAERTFSVKRTRNSSGRVTASALREALDIAFAETSALCAEFERLAEIPAPRESVTKVLDAWCPVPVEDGRTKTMRETKRAEFLRIFHTDRRNVFGESVAGLIQSHNTWQHWEQGAEDANRLARKAERTMTGQVDKADAEFAAIVAGIFDLESVPV